MRHWWLKGYMDVFQNMVQIYPFCGIDYVSIMAEVWTNAYVYQYGVHVSLLRIYFEQHVSA